MIKRAIFVLTGAEDGQRFLRILPDLEDCGLTEATLLHLLHSRRGPADPMPGLANWVRHFEAAVPQVELALKRGDPTKWIYELARMREAQLVVLSGTPADLEWDFERVTSPLRKLNIPILYLPETEIATPLARHVLLAVKAPEALDPAGPALREWCGARTLQAVCVVGPSGDPDSRRVSDVPLEIVRRSNGVAETLLKVAGEQDASLLAILAGPGIPATSPGPAEVADEPVPVVKPLIATTPLPILVWPVSQDGG